MQRYQEVYKYQCYMCVRSKHIVSIKYENFKLK